jgi:hypothetical protein
LTKSIYSFLLILFSLSFCQEVIDFAIKGIDDGVKTNRDRDYREALTDAKKKVLEKAGIELKSFTEVRNFQLIEDYIESKSEGIILPGMTIEDFGYNENGFYQVFIMGKLKTSGETISNKKLRYAQSLYERILYDEAKKELDNIIYKSEDDDLIAEAMYLKIKWNLCDDINEEFERLKAYYPDSRFIAKAKFQLKVRIGIPVYIQVKSAVSCRKVSEGTIFTSPKYEGLLRVCIFENSDKYNELYFKDYIGKINNNNSHKKAILEQINVNFGRSYSLKIRYSCGQKGGESSHQISTKERMINFKTPDFDDKIKSFIFGIYFDENCKYRTKLIPQY